jgi:hypothetical protein
VVVEVVVDLQVVHVRVMEVQVVDNQVMDQQLSLLDQVILLLYLPL